VNPLLACGGGAGLGDGLSLASASFVLGLGFVIFCALAFCHFVSSGAVPIGVRAGCLALAAGCSLISLQVPQIEPRGWTFGITAVLTVLAYVLRPRAPQSGHRALEQHVDGAVNR
jgi:hypothetical protein